jgi:membrane protein DedA with SNARE-associated domain
MDESTFAFLMLCLVSIGLAVCIHAGIKKYIFASVLSAIVSSVLFQIIGYFVLGYVDPFFIIALFTGALASFLIALLTGIPFAVIRRRSKTIRP